MNIHSTAVISPKASLGDDVEIGPYSIIGEDVVIGSNCRIDPHVVIQGPTTVGSCCQFFSSFLRGGIIVLLFR